MCNLKLHDCAGVSSPYIMQMVFCLLLFCFKFVFAAERHDDMIEMVDRWFYVVAIVRRPPHHHWQLVFFLLSQIELFQISNESHKMAIRTHIGFPIVSDDNANNVQFRFGNVFASVLFCALIIQHTRQIGWICLVVGTLNSVRSDRLRLIIKRETNNKIYMHKHIRRIFTAVVFFL